MRPGGFCGRRHLDKDAGGLPKMAMERGSGPGVSGSAKDMLATRSPSSTPQFPTLSIKRGLAEVSPPCMIALMQLSTDNWVTSSFL